MSQVKIRRRGTEPPAWQPRTARRGRIVWVLAAAVTAGCTGGPPAVPHHAATTRPARAGSLVRVPVPDYASPASVAAAFYIAWASADAVHDGPGAFAARCAPMATASLERQLAADEPPTAAWAAMRRQHVVSLLRVTAVTRPDGAPAPTSQVAYLRVYAVRVTTGTAGRTAADDGITLQLDRPRARWLVARVLFF